MAYDQVGEFMRIQAVILAAGQGTRMRSSLPKVLHPLLGRPMIQYALEVAGEVTDSRPVLVVGHGLCYNSGRLTAG